MLKYAREFGINCEQIYSNNNEYLHVPFFIMFLNIILCVKKIIAV